MLFFIQSSSLPHQWQQENKDFIALSESDTEILQGYTERANTTAGEANALLRLNGIDSYKEPVYFPDDVEQELRIAQYTEEEIREDKLFIYPNPAKDYITIEYATTDFSKGLSLIITDLSGRIVHNEQLDYPQDELVIIADKFPPGQYFCTLKNSSKVIQTQKFILVR